MNRRSPLFWIVVAFGGLVGLFVLCGVGIAVIGIFAPGRSPTVVAVRPTVPTIAPRPTNQPIAPVVPTVAPVAPTLSSVSDRYLAIAKAGIKTPLVRPGLPAGEWKVLLFGPDDVQITLPLSVGTNDQTVRLGKLAIAQVVKALFDEAPELTRVNVVGTTPTTGGELPAISIVLTRDQFATWDGLAENLGRWNVSQRLQ